MLKKAFRLPKDASFPNAKTIYTEYSLIKYKKNDLTHDRFGFVVSKRISKSAVVRNRIKRRIRSFIEERLDKISPGYDMLLIIKKKLDDEQILNGDEFVDTINKKLI